MSASNRGVIRRNRFLLTWRLGDHGIWGFALYLGRDRNPFFSIGVTPSNAAVLLGSRVLWRRP